MEEVESAKMANMAWFNAVLIVALHVMNFAQPADAASWWLRSIVHDGVCAMAVPFFFLASGWFLGRHVDEPGWWLRELKKRVRTILVPYGIFAVLSLALVVGYDAFSALAKGASVRAALPTVGGLVDAVGLNPFVLPGHDVLWFLRTLMLLVCIAPVFVVIIRRTGILLPALAFLASMAIQAVVYTADPTPLAALLKNTLNDLGFTFFLLGLYLRMSGRGLVVPWRMAVGLLAVAALMWTLRAFVLGEYLKGWSAIFTNPIALCLIFGFVGLAPTVKMPGTWTSFAIFMLHSYVIMALKLETSLPSAFTCGYYIGVIAIAVVLPMGIAWVLNEYAKPLAAVLLGGRVGSKG